MTSCRPLAHCLACGGEELRPVLSLGDQALANSYRDPGDASPETTFPLDLNRCPRCFHCQLGAAVNPDLLYRNYLYVSGTTSTLRSYFEWFADRLAAAAPCARSVLELACNDGTLLRVLRGRGYFVAGVDPAENLRSLTHEAGLDVRCAYWTDAEAEALGRQFDVLVAMNVLAHGADPLGFLQACRRALKPSGRLFVQTSQAFMIDRGEFDTIYHEHHSFFTTRSMQVLARRAGLRLLAVEHVPVHGTSLLFTLAIDGPVEPSVAAMLEQEQARGLYEDATYDKFAAAAVSVRERLESVVAAHKRQGFRVLGYGAAAKGNTVLQFAHGAGVEAVVDDNVLKQGRRLPGTGLPVLAPGALADIADPVLHVVTAWNFRDEIVRRVRAMRPEAPDRFVAYFPDVEVFG